MIQFLSFIHYVDGFLTFKGNMPFFQLDCQSIPIDSFKETHTQLCMNGHCRSYNSICFVFIWNY